MVGTTVVGNVCAILVAHIGRCGLFLVGLQQAVISLSCCSYRPLCVEYYIAWVRQAVRRLSWSEGHLSSPVMFNILEVLR